MPEPVMTITHFGASYALRVAKQRIEGHPIFKEEATDKLKALVHNVLQSILDDIEIPMHNTERKRS